MDKQRFISEYAAICGTSKKDAGFAIQGFLDMIGDALLSDGVLDIHGFGKFQVDASGPKKKVTFAPYKKLTNHAIEGKVR